MAVVDKSILTGDLRDPLKRFDVTGRMRIKEMKAVVIKKTSST